MSHPRSPILIQDMEYALPGLPPLARGQEFEAQITLLFVERDFDLVEMMLLPQLNPSFYLAYRLIYRQPRRTSSRSRRKLSTGSNARRDLSACTRGIVVVALIGRTHFHLRACGGSAAGRTRPLSTYPQD